MTTWIKLHDNFWENPKVLAAGEDAALLYVQGLSYCSRNLTNGAIPTAALRNLTAKKEARTLARILVREGLWSETATGWTVHDYLKVQRSREQVEADREKARERQRKAREAAMSRRESQRSSDEVTGDVTEPDTETEPAADSAQLILRAARAVAEERAAGRDVGVGWIVNATKGIADDHRQALLAHIEANPAATVSDLVELIEPVNSTPKSKAGGAIVDDLGIFLPGTGWCPKVAS